MSRHSRRSRHWLARVIVCPDAKPNVGAVVKTGKNAGVLFRH